MDFNGPIGQQHCQLRKIISQTLHRDNLSIEISLKFKAKLLRFITPDSWFVPNIVPGQIT